MSEEKKCGTCDYWEFGQRSYCSWGFFPGAQAISSAYKAGGAGDEVKAAVQKAGITRIDHHDCSICGVMVLLRRGG